MQRFIALAVGACVSVGLVVVSPVTPVDAGREASISCTKTYTVVSGDYWYGIARRFAVSMTSLLETNEATVDTPLLPGEVICLPDFATMPTTAPTTTTTAVPVTTTTVTTTTAPSTGTTIPGPVVPLAAFPVQGKCIFGDTYGATRSGGRVHEGVDIVAKTGNLVYAVADGTLSKQTFDKPGSLSGNAWWLTGADRTYYFYAHLAAFAPGLKAGSKVVAGQVIGYLGATGNAGSPHLHFEIHPSGGASVNPTASIKAIDACKTTDPLPQPGGVSAPAYADVAGISPTTTTTAAAPVATIATVTPAAATPPAAAAPVAQATPSPPGGGWQFIVPANAFDSVRNGTALKAGATQTIRVDTLAGVDATTSGVMVRLTANGAPGRGFLVVHRCGVPVPTAATLSYPSGATAVGTSIVAVEAGTICVTANTAVRLRVEVIAQRSANGVGLQPISSIRALDTRTTGRLLPGAVAKMDLAALGYVPGTQGLSATVTIVGPAAKGVLSLGFCGSGGWSIPFSADSLSSFSLAMRVTDAGWCVTSNMPVDVVVDITGLWAGNGALAPVDTARIYDSRTAGVTIGPAPVDLRIAGQGGVPADASRAVLSISNVAGALPGIVFAVPCDTGRSVGVVSAGTAQRISTAVVPVKLSGGVVCLSALEPVHLIIDVVAAG